MRDLIFHKIKQMRISSFSSARNIKIQTRKFKIWLLNIQEMHNTMKKIFLLLLLLTLYSYSDCVESNNPKKIVIAGGSITEIIYDLKEEDKILAVDITSNFPLEAKKLPSVGYVRALSTEGLLSLSRSLVLGEEDVLLTKRRS